MNNSDLLWSNVDLLQYTQIHADVLPCNTSRLKPRESHTLNIPASVFKLILDDIGENRHRLTQKQKQFAFSFIKSVIHKPSITSKQCKVLRDIQKQCCPNYLKVPKDWI